MRPSIPKSTDDGLASGTALASADAKGSPKKSRIAFVFLKAVPPFQYSRSVRPEPTPTTTRATPVSQCKGVGSIRPTGSRRVGTVVTEVLFPEKVHEWSGDDLAHNFAES